MCLRFSSNCLKFYCGIVLIFQDNEAEIRDGFFVGSILSQTQYVESATKGSLLPLLVL